MHYGGFESATGRSVRPNILMLSAHLRNRRPMQFMTRCTACYKRGALVGVVQHVTALLIWRA